MKLASSLRRSSLALLLVSSAAISTARAEEDSSTEALIRQLIAIQTRQLQAIENAKMQVKQTVEEQAVPVPETPAALPPEVPAAEPEPVVATAKPQAAGGGLGSQGLNLARLQPSAGLQSPTRGLSALENWRQTFPAKKKQ